MMCLYGVAIELGNYAGDSRFISTAPCHAALEENPKPQKNCHLSDRQVFTPVPRATPYPALHLGLISVVHS